MQIKETDCGKAEAILLHPSDLKSSPILAFEARTIGFTDINTLDGVPY